MQERYSPLVKQAEKEIEKHQSKQSHDDKQSKLERDTKEVQSQLSDAGVTPATDSRQAALPQQNNASELSRKR